MAIWTHVKTGLEFVLVPGGRFQMGSPSSEADRDDDEKDGDGDPPAADEKDKDDADPSPTPPAADEKDKDGDRGDSAPITRAHLDSFAADFSAIQRSIFCCSMTTVTVPSSITRSWNSRMSKSSPSAASA